MFQLSCFHRIRSSCIQSKDEKTMEISSIVSGVKTWWESTPMALRVMYAAAGALLIVLILADVKKWNKEMVPQHRLGFYGGWAAYVFILFLLSIKFVSIPPLGLAAPPRGRATFVNNPNRGQSSRSSLIPVKGSAGRDPTGELWGADGRVTTDPAHAVYGSGYDPQAEVNMQNLRAAANTPADPVAGLKGYHGETEASSASNSLLPGIRGSNMVQPRGLPVDQIATNSVLQATPTVPATDAVAPGWDPKNFLPDLGIAARRVENLSDEVAVTSSPLAMLQKLQSNPDTEINWAANPYITGVDTITTHRKFPILDMRGNRGIKLKLKSHQVSPFLNGTQYDDYDEEYGLQNM